MSDHLTPIQRHRNMSAMPKIQNEFLMNDLKGGLSTLLWVINVL